MIGCIIGIIMSNYKLIVVNNTLDYAKAIRFKSITDLLRSLCCELHIATIVNNDSTILVESRNNEFYMEYNFVGHSFDFLIGAYKLNNISIKHRIISDKQFLIYAYNNKSVNIEIVDIAIGTIDSILENNN